MRTTFKDAIKTFDFNAIERWMPRLFGPHAMIRDQFIVDALTHYAYDVDDTTILYECMDLVSDDEEGIIKTTIHGAIAYMLITTDTYNLTIDDDDDHTSQITLFEYEDVALIRIACPAKFLKRNFIIPHPKMCEFMLSVFESLYDEMPERLNLWVHDHIIKTHNARYKEFRKWIIHYDKKEDSCPVCMESGECALCPSSEMHVMACFGCYKRMAMLRDCARCPQCRTAFRR